MSESEQLRSEQQRGAELADLIGRGPERDAILAALDPSADRIAAVLLTGDAGIGKTAIWESIVAERRAAGDHVLISRATSAEARLPWVGMTDLMRTMPPTTLDSLPDVQRRALEVVSLQTGALPNVGDARRTHGRHCAAVGLAVGGEKRPGVVGRRRPALPRHGQCIGSDLRATANRRSTSGATAGHRS